MIQFLLHMHMGIATVILQLICVGCSTATERRNACMIAYMSFHEENVYVMFEGLVRSSFFPIWVKTRTLTSSFIFAKCQKLDWTAHNRLCGPVQLLCAVRLSFCDWFLTT